MSTTNNGIGLILPRYVKKLDIEIKNLEDTQVTLNHSKHLSRITLRSYHIVGLGYTDEIHNPLKNMKRNFQYQLDWGIFVGYDCCDSVQAVCIWLDKMYE